MAPPEKKGKVKKEESGDDSMEDDEEGDYESDSDLSAYNENMQTKNGSDNKDPKSKVILLILI